MPGRETEARTPLSRERILGAAVALADEGGVDSVTMRKLAGKLGVEAMSLYNHVANKDDILDGMVDAVFGEIVLPGGGEDWKDAMRRRARSVREALSRHRWAIGLLESRATPGPSTMRHHDAVIGTLRGAGFSIGMTAHAYALLDSYIYGFALQESSLPFEGPEEVPEMAAAMMEAFPADAFPHLAEFAAEHVMQPGYDFGSEFEFGLEVILEGLERMREAETGGPGDVGQPAGGGSSLR